MYKRIRLSNQRRIVRIDKNGIEQVFESPSAAVMATPGTGTGNICSCIRGNRQSCAGYRWRYDRDGLPGETWLEIKEGYFSGVYVSTEGRVKTTFWGKVLTPQLKDGYHSVNLKGKNPYVHQLVCYAYHGLAPTTVHTPDHIDRIRTNNTPGNLRWASKAEQNSNRSTSGALGKLFAN